ncbi:MAG: hypothetical protein IJ793_00905 [Opitutales bacterium]|nr:hypothetical protein [Opitutales bacterium]
MKFRRIPLLLLSVAFPAFSNVHADLYDVKALAAHLKQKLESIQAEYEKLQQKQQLSYFWDKGIHNPSNLFLLFRKNILRSTENLREMAATLFSFEDLNVKEQLEKKFLPIFMSEEFLRMLFGDNIVNKLITCNGEDGACVFWDKEEYNNPSGKLLFFLRVKHTPHEDSNSKNPSVWDIFMGGRWITALDMQFVFAYDTKNDNIQFIGTKDKIFINGKGVKMDFPIYSPSYTNASVPKNNSMNMD